MINELIFLLHVSIIGISLLSALAVGLHALISLICLLVVLSNVFLLKQIDLFGWTATGVDAYTIGAVLGLNLLQEYFGKSVTRHTIWISFSALVFYGLVSQIQLWYVPSMCDTMQLHYAAFLQFMPRIIAASFFAYVTVAQLDVYLFAFLQRAFSGNYLALRTFISIIICQGIDTVLFSFLGLYGIITNLHHVIVVSYSIKLCTIIIAMPFVALSKKILKPTM